VVAGGLQPDGQRRDVVERGEAAVAAAVVVDAGRVRVLGGEEARAARRAEVGRDVAVLEAHALLDDLAHHRRHHGRDPVERVGRVDRVEALVVGEDEDDVRPQRRRIRSDAVDPGLEQRDERIGERRPVDRVADAGHGRVKLRADVGEDHLAHVLRDADDALERDLSIERRALASASASRGRARGSGASFR